MAESSFRMIAVAAIAALGILSYFDTLDGQWVWDDVSSVLLHKNVQAPAHLLRGDGDQAELSWGQRLAGVFPAVAQLFREDQHAFGRGQGNFYRPLVSLTFAADYALTPAPGAREGASALLDLSPLVFHLGNLLWHLLAACLCFALLTCLDAPRFVRAVAPLIFVVHPLHTEAVAYISGRADLLSATFMLAALCLALSGGPGGRVVLRCLASLFCFAAALCSKESSSIYPLLLAVLLLLQLEPWKRVKAETGHLVRQSMPLVLALAVLGGYAALRMTVLHFGAPQAGGSTASPLPQRLVETLQAFAFYLRALFVPVHLHMEQSLADTPRWTAVLGFGGLAACIAILVAAVRKRRKHTAMGLAWFLAAWLPISGLFPLNAPMAEHWMYVPMIGFWWALADLLWAGVQKFEAVYPRSGAVAAVATGLLVLFLGGMTVARNNEWSNNERLFLATLRENPESARVNYNLAVEYQDLRGNPAGARRHYEEVLRLGRRAGFSNLAPDYLSDLYLSLARTSYQQRDFSRAFEYYARLATNQTNRAYAAEAGLGLGKSALAMGDLGPSFRYLEQAANLDPKTAPEIKAIIEGAPLLP